MASTMFATEVTTSSFMGTAMPNSTAVSGKARVTMGFSASELQRKPLSLIRTLARQRGIPMSNKQQMINQLASSTPSYGSSSSFSYSAPRTSSAASSASEGEYASKTLGELRALAKARGLRGDTRAEIIALLKSSPAPAAGSSSYDSYSSSSFSAPSYPAAEAPKALPKAVLERKSLSELRAMARIRGLRGDTKAELVKLLADNESAGGQVLSSTPSYSAPSYSSSSNGSYASSNGAPKSNPTVVKQLSLKSLGQLRAMAAIRGIRGATKDELVRQLALL